MEDFLMAKDTKDGNNLNEKSYVNKKLLQCYLIISMVLLAAYIMELVKGNRTAGYVFVFSIILIVPVIMAAFAYKKNAESKIVRSITAIGYGILYAFVLWTSVSILSFTYAIPTTLGAFIEPGTVFYFKDGSFKNTIRDKHPLHFNLQLGVRWNY